MDQQRIPAMKTLTVKRLLRNINVWVNIFSSFILKLNPRQQGAMGQAVGSVGQGLLLNTSNLLVMLPAPLSR